VNKETLSTVTNVVLVGCALLVTAALVRREFFPPPVAAAVPPSIHEVAHWADLAARGHTLGPDTATVRIVEFSDFQCPFCAQLEPQLAALRAGHPGRLAVIYRHFPLPAHKYAVAAALASECAADQGRFEAYHDALFQSQDSIGVLSWDGFARRAGVPQLGAFRDCVVSQRDKGRVDGDAAAASSISAAGTPTLVVNGRMLGSSAQLDSVVTEELRHSRR